MSKKEICYADFDVNEVSVKINSLMSRWSTNKIEIKGQNWKIFNHAEEIIYEFNFLIDFKNIEARIKLEDLRLNVIHHIESLKDDTAYVDELMNENLLY